jgi:hypothetical protein
MSHDHAIALRHTVNMIVTGGTQLHSDMFLSVP